MTALLAIEDLHVCYGKVEAVHGVSLHLDAGQIVSVIGPNGAGKSTLLSAAIGLLPSQGRILFDGQEIGRLGVEDRVERGLCLVPETRELFGEMSVLDNLLLGAYVRRESKADRRRQLELVYARFPRLAERRTQRAETLSGGERQMLAISRALISNPTFLLLDEPTAALSPLYQQQIIDRIDSLREQGITVLIVEQNARLSLSRSDRGYIMASGKIVHTGDASHILTDPEIGEYFLGGTSH